jgi:hypothetical protein
MVKRNIKTSRTIWLLSRNKGRKYSGLHVGLIEHAVVACEIPEPLDMSLQLVVVGCADTIDIA